MSNKFVVYTSNVPFKPSTLDDIIKFAKKEGKFRIAPVELNAYLANVQVGDNIITKKGNSLYILRTIGTSLDNLSEEDQEYIDNLTRNYNLKKVNITSVSSRIKFADWCKAVKPLINNSNNNKTMKTNNSLKGFSARIKEMFMPSKAENIRIATDGSICVATSQGYVSINANNELISYPEEFTFDFPVFTISKPREQLSVGDIIALDKSYAKITKIDGGKISAISYTGAGKTIHTIKDFLFNNTMVRVVVSLSGNLDGQVNPLMMLAMAGDNDKDSLLSLLMMSQNGSNLSMNPMMMIMLAKDKENLSIKDMLMMSAISGGNNLGNMFNLPNQPVAQVPTTQVPVAQVPTTQVPTAQVPTVPALPAENSAATSKVIDVETQE